ncbi:MAG: asparagine synthase (glutamine-hydrolyzing) [Rhodocyclaceae bacterium]|nr:asparagine synthase (glutamine-hydrolyzing) [Rhodocyclaceae bacterium]
MCGIAGIHFKREVSSAELDAISAYFAASLQHRGPDAFGAHRTARSIFANLRLAIVDRAGGDQPIYAPGGSHGIVYNGEVYNWEDLRRPLEAGGYPFATHADTEAVLAVYVKKGEKSFAELNGMFALCIWDEKTGSFTLARDRFGAKPLYIYEDAERFAFASEIKTLLGLPGIDDTLNPLGFQDYLTYRYALAPHTLFKCIEKLPAGCSLRYDAKGRHLHRFAEIELREPKRPKKPQAYVEELDHILGNAVRSQLMGEVPIGVLLSGGLDSSAIACYIQRAGARLKAYSIGFAEVNEFPFSRDVARQFDLDYVEICMTQEELLAGMDATLLRLDEPIADPACFALTRLCEEIKKDVTVVLSGEGGDEMFAGYGQHLFALDPALDRERCFAQFFTYSANYDDAKSWLRDKNLPPEHMRYKAAAYDRADTALNGMLSFELHTWMPENLMMKADKVLMSHSLEGRFPFLDLELYNFAARLPQAMKLPSPASSKHVLRTLMTDKLPRSVIERRKMGFTVPPSFFLQRLRARFETAIDALRGQPVADVLDLDAIAQLVRDFYAGQQGIPVFKVWNIFVLVFWFAYAYPLFRKGSAGANLQSLLRDLDQPGVHLEDVAAGKVPAPQPALAMPIGRKPRLAVYTVLMGDKEPLGNPLCDLPPGATTDIDIDYVCLTDNHALRSDVWTFAYIDSGHLPPEKLSRRPKTMPHAYLADYDFSLYIDNTVALKRLPALRDLGTARPYLFKVFRHATRHNPWEEADAVATLGYEDVGTICDQLDFYAQKRPLESITPLSTCTVILRSHNHAKVAEFGTTWWEEILAFSKRDQLSFDFALANTGCAVEYFNGYTNDNEFIRWPVRPRERRVLASFDAKRYAWMHRNDPEAAKNPRAHFLAHEHGDGATYAHTIPLFDYICHKQGSSLGSHVSPRRGVGVALGDILSRYREGSGKLLLVRIRDEAAPLRFVAEELDPASTAVSMMLNKYKAQTFDLSAADLRQPVVFGNSPDRYDAMVFIGLPPDCMPALIGKFSGLLSPAGGLVAVAAAGECDLGAIKSAQEQITQQFGTATKVSVGPSRHDDRRDPVANSLVCFEWSVAGALLAERARQEAPAIIGGGNLPGRSATALHMAFCDGGLSNRLNALIFALILRRKFGHRWAASWPKNTWCGAAFDRLFEIDVPIHDYPINYFKEHENEYLLLMHENQCDFNPERIVINKGLTSYDQYKGILDANERVLYYNNLFPPFVTFDDMKLGLASLRIEAGVRQRAEAFCAEHRIDASVLGLHIRKTDFGGNVNDDELFKLAASSQHRFFVCSDDKGVNERFSQLSNCAVFEKSYFPQKAQDSGEWLHWVTDAEGRKFPFNIDRSEESVVEGLVDLLILSRTTLVKTSHSTFLTMAGIFKGTGFF